MTNIDTQKLGLGGLRSWMEESRHLGSSACLLLRVEQGGGVTSLASLGRDKLWRGALFRLQAGRKLWWTFSEHTISVHTGVPEVDFAIPSLSQGRLCHSDGTEVLEPLT